jgi:hypothetical protein
MSAYQISRAIGLAVFLLFLPVGSPAADKPAVRVQFSLAEPVYSAQFSPREIKDLVSATTSFLVRRLSDEIGFLRFASASSASFTMTFTLGEATADRTEHHEVRIHILLTGPRVTGRATDWPFRDDKAWGGSFGGLVQFEREIRDQMSKHLPGNLVSELLSLIPLASDVGSFIHPRPQIENAWVLPFRQIDLCMAANSEVKLANEVSTPFAVIPQEFLAVAKAPYSPSSHTAQDEELRGYLLFVPEPLQDGLAMMSQSEPSAVKVKKVFVTRYFKMSPCPSRP